MFLTKVLPVRHLLHLILLILIFGPIFQCCLAFAQQEEEKEEADTGPSAVNEPKINDPTLKAELVAKGLEFPTSMTFIGPDDILVLEKNKGTVKRIVEGQILGEPLLDVNVASDIERGMLGIATKKDTAMRYPYVYLYFTESESRDGEDLESEEEEKKDPLGNRLYRYELADNRLVNPKLLLNLPAHPHPAHNGGKLMIGPDNNIYLTIGDIKGYKDESSVTRAQNVRDGTEPDGRAGILRFTLDGQPVPNGAIIGDEEPMNFYYAYGIRNSFGMDFDPVTGKLWDTENGPGYGDEINMVEPGFNSGWMSVQGIWTPDEELRDKVGVFDPEGSSGLEDFDGRGKYSPPQFTWEETLGPTALKFLNSSELGERYRNDMFVADFNRGNIYNFDLDIDRTGLSLRGQLADKVANNMTELEDVILASGLGSITDMDVGPDGNLYILSQYLAGESCNEEGTNCSGTIFKISRKT
jgi:aldose sugar dehydrogenase